MDAHDPRPAEAEWRESAGRAKTIWDRYVGGTVEVIARELEAVGLAMPPASLGQTLRPKGRKPRQSADLLIALTRVLASKLSSRRPDLTPAQLEEALKRHILVGAVSPFDEAPKVGANIAWGEALTALWSFDLWTPGQSGETIVRQFAPALGLEIAGTVRDLSRDAVEAIGRGDFARQSEVADQAITLGSAAPETPLLGEGLYLKGEALRLMADFEADSVEARRLRREAEQFYGRAEEALRGDPRPIRGRARTIEVLGDFVGALEGFEDSLAAVQARRTAAGEVDYLSLTHERVRTLRHKINCLAAMHVTPLATLAAQRRAEEIRRLILESEPRHQAALQFFEQHKDWWLIEWFMTQVLHAKGWVAIQEEGRAAKRLEWSLKQRLAMMPDQGPLTPVELGNLHWWASVARDVRSALEPGQERALELLKEALDRGEHRPSLKELGQRFLAAGAAPWSTTRSST